MSDETTPAQRAQRAIRVVLRNDEEDAVPDSKLARLSLGPAVAHAIRPGTALEYDVYLEGAPPSVGAIDLRFTDGTYLSDQPGLYDQNGIHGQPQSNIVPAANSWYHRLLALPTAVIGRVPEEWSLLSTNSLPGSISAALYSAAVLTDEDGAVYSVSPLAVTNPPTILQSIGLRSVEVRERPRALDVGTPGIVGRLDVDPATIEGEPGPASAAASGIIGSGYRVEYDVLLVDTSASGAGGLELVTSNGRSTDDSGWTDQFGVSADSTSDITHIATGSWVHRVMPISDEFVGEQMSEWRLGGLTSNVHQALYSNVRVTSSDGQIVTELDLRSIGAQRPGLSWVWADMASLAGGASSDELFLQFQNGGEPPVPRQSYLGVSPKHLHWAFSDERIELREGDELQYEITYTEFGLRPGAAVDLVLDDHSLASDSGWIDQLGLSAHPATDIQLFTAHRWMRRRVVIPVSLHGRTVNRWLLSAETDQPDAYGSIGLRNVRIVNSGRTRVVGYSGGRPGLDLPHSRGENVAAVMEVRSAKPYPAAITRVAETEFSQSDVAIHGFSVTDFGAAGDGITDDTTAFQTAIFAAKQAGGSVVFAPTARYRIAGRLFLPEGVTLRGDWRSPHAGPAVGTVLMASADRGNRDALAFLSLYGSSAVRDLVIWYPEQSFDDVVAYPPTIRATYLDHAAVENVTLVNSFVGIECGPSFNELATIHNVYGTALDVGLSFDSMPDIPRLERIELGPDVWATTGLPGSPSTMAERERLADYTRGNARGIAWARVDLGYIYDVRLTSFRVGIDLVNEPFIETGARVRGGSANVARLVILDGMVGVRLAAGSLVWGLTFSDCSIGTRPGPDAVAVLATWSFISHAGFNGCVFSGGTGSCVVSDAGGAVSFQNCDFREWESIGTAPVVESGRGSITVAGCEFGPAELHLSVAPTSRSAALAGNSAVGGLTVEGEVEQSVGVDTSVPFARRNYDRHVYRSIPWRVTGNEFLDARDLRWGVDPEGVADATHALQKLLGAAAISGGGTVYLPSGRYRIEGALVVPTGVELRGTFDTSHHTSAPGTMLLAMGGRGHADAEPLITLSDGAGIRGLTIYHPEQMYADLVPYPWSIRVAGSDARVLDVSLVNSWRGIEVGGQVDADRHIIRGVGGCFLFEGIMMGMTATEGWIENVHINPHYWFRANVPGSPASDIYPDWFSTVYAQMSTGLTALTLGASKMERLLGVFTYGSHTALSLVEQHGQAGNLIGYNVGLDSIRLGIDAQATGTFGVDLVGVTYYAVRPDPTRAFVRTQLIEGSGPLRIFNAGGGDTNSSVAIAFDLQAGHAVLQQIFANTSPAEVFCKISGGAAELDSVVSFQPADQLAVSGENTVVRVAASTFAGRLLEGSWRGVTTVGNATRSN